MAQSKVECVAPGQWLATIDEGGTCKLNKLKFPQTAKVTATAKDSPEAILFIYWNRIDQEENPNNAQPGTGVAEKQWNNRTGETWIVEVENRSGPNGLQVEIVTNATTTG